MQTQPTEPGKVAESLHGHSLKSPSCDLLPDRNLRDEVSAATCGETILGICWPDSQRGNCKDDEQQFRHGIPCGIQEQRSLEVAPKACGEDIGFIAKRDRKTRNLGEQ
jgi:hypothetical protein